MTRAERLALLGPTVIAEIHERVKSAPEPPDDAVAELRRIMTQPGGTAPTSATADAA